MIHAFDGTFDLRRRPLRDLATVLDMTGFGFEVLRDALRSNEPGLSIDATVSSQHGYNIAGGVDDTHHDPEDVMCRLALAMEADGIGFALRLLDADGAVRVTYESDR